MSNMTSAIRDTISITLFNRGLAGKIFEDVKRSGAKVVMKNNRAECVLLSPDEYIRLMDEINDAHLLAMATDRISKCAPSDTLSAEQVYKNLGISDADLVNCDEVEIE